MSLTFDYDEPNDMLDDLISDAIVAVTGGRKSPPQPTATEDVLYTCDAGDLALTVIRVDVDRRVTHQLYACGVGGQWALVGSFGLYTDALSEVCTWRRYIAAGGTLASFMAAHPDGIRPDLGSAGIA